MNKVAVIGSGFSGLSASCFLADAGFDVTVFEKNDTPGGRARCFQEKGFTFDMGPSWYWMPDVFEDFFSHFGKKPSDYYELIRLDPSYRIIYNGMDRLDVPADLQKLYEMFELLEPGSSKNLDGFLTEGKCKYDIGMHELVYKPGLKASELLNTTVVKEALSLHMFQSMRTYVRKFFRAPKLIQLIEFPVLFLGATAEKTPALYSLMSYADMALGTWYPRGGIYKVVEAMYTLAKSLGVKFNFGSSVQSIEVDSGKATGIIVNETHYQADHVVASADYHHVEQELLPAQFRNYPEVYWQKKTMAPSCLIFFLGINKRLNNLLHHTLFFDEDFSQHAHEIYTDPQWPHAPQFYVSCASISDPTCCPKDCEALFILIPVASGLDDTEEVRARYFELIMNRMEKLTGQNIREHIIVKRMYAHRDFIDDYNAFKGNAYGLANTVLQTANLRPTIINKKLKNLFYTGQLTVPGPGVPPAIISGQVVASELIKTLREFVT